MSDLPFSIDPISGIAGLISQGINAASQERQNDRAEAYADKDWERRLALQHEAWSRDDTKYGRLVTDLKNSGINPMLATGNPTASQSTPAVGSTPNPHAGSSRAPQVDPVSIMQMALTRAQIDKTRAETFVAADTYDRQKAAGILPGANPVINTIDQLLNRLGTNTDALINATRNGIDDAVSLVKEAFSNSGLPSLITTPNIDIRKAIQNALDDRDMNPTDDNIADRIKSALDALINNRAAPAHQQFPTPAKEPFPDPSIDAGDARSDRARRNSPTQPRNNLK